MLGLANLSLLVLFPVAWVAPLARAGLLPFFGLDEISVLSGVASLWESDKALAILVVLLAMALPLLKTLWLAAIHLGRAGPRALPVLTALSKLAMADIFLIAVYIVVAKGVGVGRIETAWGLWLFTFCVATSMLVTHLTKKKLDP
ncbi:paraquat-inducible protein A [Halovulum dunhuangense]|uniref:paraquat-inducible protein A n=1 Tax=Halovulum dunhuangense TaxID=1505036 RepID=UPI003CCC8F49